MTSQILKERETSGESEVDTTTRQTESGDQMSTHKPTETKTAGTANLTSVPSSLHDNNQSSTLVAVPQTHSHMSASSCGNDYSHTSSGFGLGDLDCRRSARSWPNTQSDTSLGFPRRDMQSQNSTATRATLSRPDWASPKPQTPSPFSNRYQSRQDEIRQAPYVQQYDANAQTVLHSTNPQDTQLMNSLVAVQAVQAQTMANMETNFTTFLTNLGLHNTSKLDVKSKEKAEEIKVLDSVKDNLVLLENIKSGDSKREATLQVLLTEVKDNLVELKDTNKEHKETLAHIATIAQGQLNALNEINSALKSSTSVMDGKKAFITFIVYKLVTKL